MRYQFKNNLEEIISAKKVLQRSGMSQRLLQRIQNEGRLIDENENDVEFSDKLMPFEPIWIELPDEEQDQNVAISDGPLDIIFEDKNWLLVNKPAGLTAVPGPSDREDTLVNRIKGHWQAIESKNMMPHLVTRLDRFTSGITLVARHQVSNSLLSEQVAHHKIKKIYLAMVDGVVQAEKGTFNQPLGLAADGIHREVRDDGQQATTSFKVLKRFENQTLVQIHLKTGRTHQIRVHFANAGHPLVGDQLYDGPMDRGIKRQALHASSIRFFDPFIDEKVSFTAELSDDLKQIGMEE
ncbi:RluA family pseudouridine synthase [Pediococcus pentosaceus]|uniref:RluA family pseudouridine synthase n=1 Tax=Pediococcus pentosaceus TaxID=1255 RepID=UPI0018A1579C|nr:RluA family pseudouridine synthase [Pediococcus pentosaceus]MBF7129619.1 RluA family pseudouridine synthase [Pediococcus pentosaceus]MBF7132921.1 RluA family pseudouridine synthase [Pediococcus pentosaceus]